VTTYTATADEAMTDDSTDTSDDAFWRSQTVLDPGEEMAEPELYPRLLNMPYVLQGCTAGYGPPGRRVRDASSVLLYAGEARELDVAVAQWNMLWEPAQYRRHVFDEDDLPSPHAADGGSWRLRHRSAARMM